MDVRFVGVTFNRSYILANGQNAPTAALIAG